MKLTEWYPAHIKPVHVGVYETYIVKDDFTYQYWNGTNWGYFKPSPNKAYLSKDGISNHQSVKWRGIAK